VYSEYLKGKKQREDVQDKGKRREYPHVSHVLFCHFFIFFFYLFHILHYLPLSAFQQQNQKITYKAVIIKVGEISALNQSAKNKFLTTKPHIIKTTVKKKSKMKKNEKTEFEKKKKKQNIRNKTNQTNKTDKAYKTNKTNKKSKT
jgi:hypothetical protein